MVDLPPLSTASKRGSAQQDLWLVAFTLGDETYGIDVDEVKAIYHAVPLIPVSGKSGQIDGHLRLADSNLPVVDLRRIAELPVESHYRELVDWIVAVGTGSGQVGFIVDKVDEVMKLLPSALQTTVNSQKSATFPLRGIAEANGREVLIPEWTHLIKEVTS
jgi:purine-binding chemotaxis protein CheW